MQNTKSTNQVTRQGQNIRYQRSMYKDGKYGIVARIGEIKYQPVAHMGKRINCWNKQS